MYLPSSWVTNIVSWQQKPTFRRHDVLAIISVSLKLYRQFLLPFYKAVPALSLLLHFNTGMKSLITCV
jgi:hypothetical protein